MTVVVVGGPPSAGKTRVIHRALDVAAFEGPVGVAKLDCLEGGDEALWRARGVPVRALLAGDVCPDHVLMERFPELAAWGEGLELGTLVVETAGLCGRCAPYLREALAVAVLDATAGIAAPRKFGPLLDDADLVVITRGDLVSQAEREAFGANVRSRNPRAPRVWLDGRTGEGSQALAAALKAAAGAIRAAAGLDGASDARGPRTPLPQMYCSYCLGRDQAGIAVL
jgi:Ni2+-binding GTPase involved in maturation of urease and hydrogenase